MTTNFFIFMYFMLLLIVICVVRRSWAPVEGHHSKIWWWWWWWWLIHVGIDDLERPWKVACFGPYIFWQIFISMHILFDLKWPQLAWQQIGEGLACTMSTTPHLKGLPVSSKCLGPPTCAHKVWAGVTKFGTVTRGGACFFRVLHVRFMPQVPLLASLVAVIHQQCILNTNSDK